MGNFPDTDLAEAMKKIADLAKQDGTITPEEYNILENMSFNVAEYLIELENSMEDGVIDDDEAVELNRLKDKIIVNAKKIASQDGVVDSDEQQILNKLIEILQGKD